MAATAEQQDSAIAEMSFEAAMAALEKIVEQLETGRASLEDSITLYERGAALRAHCDAKLKQATMRVQQIVHDADGHATGVTASPLEHQIGAVQT